MISSILAGYAALGLFVAIVAERNSRRFNQTQDGKWIGLPLIAIFWPVFLLVCLSALVRMIFGDPRP